MNNRKSRPEDANLANWREAPYNRWAFHHVSEIIASAPVANDPANISPLPRGPKNLDGLLFKQLFLKATATDAIVVLVDGQIAFEWSANGNIDEPPKLLFAMGIHVQNLFVDRTNQVVIAKLSSWNKPVDSLSIWLTHKAVGKIQRALVKGKA